jgi:hypothetical protein
MKFIPILFSTPMVQAILEGRKTQTRRIVDMPKEDITDATWGYTCFTPDRHISFRGKHSNGQYGESFVKSKYGKKGDVLWVRESFMPLDLQEDFSDDEDDDNAILKCEFGYKAGGRMWANVEQDYYDRVYDLIDNMEQEGEKWKPSIHMPKSACRLFLQIESIRVERLHDISKEDAMKEGYPFEPHRVNPENHAQSWFHQLWIDINGNWNDNPWVWVIQFKRIEKPDGFLSSAHATYKNDIA